MSKLSFARLEAAANAIHPLDRRHLEQAQTHLDSLTKPPGSLGRLEECAARLFAVQGGRAPLAIDPARVVTVAGDHGVVAEGVSSSPSEVTRQQVENFLRGEGGISVMCRASRIEHQVVDAGVMGDDFTAHPMLIRRKIAPGTANMAHGPAMSRAECLCALELGLDLAEQAHSCGIRCLGTGEMGIGNTTPSTALFSVLLGLDPGDIVGPGAGVPPAGMAGKVAIIRKAIAVNEGAVRDRDPFGVLAALGGLEIATLVGFILGAAGRNMPLVIDGFISTAAYVSALSFAPFLAGRCFFAHASAEPGFKTIMEKLDEKPLLDLGMRLGEGTGAALAITLLRNAAAVYNEMATFASAGVFRAAR